MGGLTIAVGEPCASKVLDRDGWACVLCVLEKVVSKFIILISLDQSS